MSSLLDSPTDGRLTPSPERLLVPCGLGAPSGAKPDGCSAGPNLVPYLRGCISSKSPLGVPLHCLPTIVFISSPEFVIVIDLALRSSCLSLCQPPCFDYCSFVVVLKPGNVSPSVSFLFFKIPWTIRGFSRLHMNYRMRFSISAKRIIRVLLGAVPNLQVTLGNVDILTLLSLPIHERGCVSIYLHFL